MRITNASLPLDGIVPIKPNFDTPGLLVRDPTLLRDSYKGRFTSKSYTSYPEHIVMPTEFWPSTANLSMATCERFISGIVSFLNATDESVNTNDSFISYIGESEGIQTYLDGSFSNVNTYDQVNMAVETRREHEAEFGEHPLWNPVPVVEWGYGYAVTEAHSAIEKVTTFSDWYRSEMVPTCEDTLIVYPFGPGIEGYRNVYVDPPTPFGASYAATLQAIYAGVPDYTVPIRERTYFSRITQRDETLPVIIGIIADSNSEAMLADMVVEMSKTDLVPGLEGAVKTGKSMY